MLNCANVVPVSFGGVPLLSSVTLAKSNKDLSDCQKSLLNNLEFSQEKLIEKVNGCQSLQPISL
jgi:hypothetical protein